MDFYDLILELENELTDTDKGIFAKKINVQKCLSLIDAIKRAYPSVIKDANYVVASKEEILLEAERKAKQIIKEAEMHSNAIIKNSEIMKRAEAAAAAHYENVRQACDDAINKAAAIIYTMFEDTEDFLKNMLEILKQNRDDMINGLKDSNK
ncbi:MAG TPA: hypothetical protein VIL23_02835 [Clostridia bacterium]